jgi:hypothetical protein
MQPGVRQLYEAERRVSTCGIEGYEYPYKYEDPRKAILDRQLSQHQTKPPAPTRRGNYI